jgi:hypothetical protein
MLFSKRLTRCSHSLPNLRQGLTGTYYTFFSSKSLEKTIKYIPPGATASDFEWSSFPVEHVPEMLYQLTKRRKSNVKVWTSDVFVDISNKLMEKPKTLFSNVDVSKLFFGLNSMPERHPNVELINRALCHLLQRSYAREKYPWSSYNISCAMYYLRHQQCGKKHVRDLISVCAELVVPPEEVDRPLSTAEAGNILYGLQGLSSDTQCVRELISALLPHLERAELEVDSFFIADLFALQRLSSEVAEVAALLDVLSAKLCTHSGGDSALLGRLREPIPIKAVQVCRALFGLQLMRMEHDSVRRLVRQLAPYVALPQGPAAIMHPKEVALVLDGMRQLFSSAEARLAALRVEQAGAGATGEDLDLLTARLARAEADLALLRSVLGAVGQFQLQCRSSTPLNTDQMARIFHSFRGFSSKYPEVRLLLENLLPFVRGPVVTLHQSSYSDSRSVTDMLSVHNSIRVAGGSSFYRRINGKPQGGASASAASGMGGAAADSNALSGGSAANGCGPRHGGSKFDAYQMAIIKQGLAGVGLPSASESGDRRDAHARWEQTVQELALGLREQGVLNALVL